MKITGLLLLLIATITTAGYFFWNKPKFDLASKKYSFHVKANNANTITELRLKDKAATIRKYVAAVNYNTTVCFMIDMKISSGKKRFFVYNLEKDSVEMSGLVTHGSGSDKADTACFFSNTTGSLCTSLGKYKVGKPYNGRFGLAYKLYGLDKTNNHAFERFVVLHSHYCIPDAEVYPEPICQSWGCPTVSPTFLKSLKKYIDHSEKPILLNIYD
ncbi:MAG: murein L,D-transpeptidase catalytic domain family protein [Ferruginibacter sp.]